MRYLMIFIIIMLLIVGIFAQDTVEVLMDGDKSITAHFKKIQYTLTTSVEPIGSGTISGAGIYDVGMTVEVEAIPASGYIFDHWSFGKWSGLGMVLYSSQASYVDILLANEFIELRIDIPDYQNTGWLNYSKVTLPGIIAKGANVIWGVSSNAYNSADYTITAENWPTFRQAILDAAQWAQDNGVYEFQLGNEEEFHVDGDTMTEAQIITNLKSVATDVQAIFTNGNVSYSCAHDYINDWITAGKGDLDILASNIYMGGEGNYSDDWKTEIDNLINAFGADSTYITEFNLSWSSLDDYSTDETVQATALTEMIEYIKASGITRAFYYAWKNDEFGVIKDDGTYRLLWDSLINSE